MKAIDTLAIALLIVGGLNWGLVGLADVDLVQMALGTTVLATAVYTLVGLSAVYQAMQWRAMQRRWGLALTAALLMATPAAAQDRPAAEQPDIVEAAVSAGSFTTLVAALQAADLVDVLKGDGPFTVFAPTDEAFSNLPAGTIEELLRPENRETLRAILTYHVVPGRVLAQDVAGLTQAVTVQGQALRITVADGTPMVDNARVVQADLVTSNGVIHVIDTVVLPNLD